jgi:hypothetical protein
MNIKFNILICTYIIILLEEIYFYVSILLSVLYNLVYVDNNK